MTQIIIDINHTGVVNRQELEAAFTRLKKGQHLLTTKNITKRTLSQNAYYWAVIIPLCRIGLNRIGYNEVKTDDETHDILKNLFLKAMATQQKTLSTSLLNRSEFTQYVGDIQQWAAEFLSTYIPDPNEPLELLCDDYEIGKQKMVDDD